jgi:peptidoglycan-N-acetylglucosamine deacetylase
MMSPMQTLAETGSFSLTARAVATSAPLGFLLAVEKDPHIAGTALYLLLVTAVAALAVRRLPSNRPLAVAGGAVAVTAAWLVAQRDDVIMALILAFLFTLAVGLVVVEPPAPLSPSTRNAAIGAIAVWFALRFTVSENAILTVVVIVVIVAAAATALGLSPTRDPYRTHSLAFGAVLVAVTLVLTGYIGAETPDVTWFGGGAVHGPTNTNEVALTFDDGPNVGSTEKVMAILDAHGIKGTFFEVGKAIDADPQITRALYADGQLLGNHSYHHDQWRWLNPRYPELQRTQDAFQRAIGTCPVLYRPPHGDRTPFLARVVKDQHMHMVLWSASAGDWATNDAQLVARRILANARPGAILLLHDGLDGLPTKDRSVLVRALPTIIDGLRAKGLKPVRLDQLLGTAAYQKC